MRYLLLALLLCASAAPAFARAGSGGGFSSGGGYYHSSGYNRGYSGGYSSRSPFGRRNTLFDLIFLAVAGTVLLINKITSRDSAGSGVTSSVKNAAVPRETYSGRAEKTRAIMQSLTADNPEFDPGNLETFVRKAFNRVEKAWQDRDYNGLGDIMMPALLSAHEAKVQAMRQRGEINVMENLSLLRVDFVHVRCTREKEGRTFTALVTASACDYMVDESSYSRGPSGREPEPFQEFWTFYRLYGNWALARIDQPSEMDFLNAPNLPETPAGAAPSPAQPFAAAGAAAPFAAAAPFTAAAAYAPAPPKAPAALKWDRQKMEIAATLAFESVYGAWGRNDAALLSADFVSGEALAKLRKLLEARKGEGLSFEFKDLFTRRAEVVLTTPAEKNDLRLDEFTARITATSIRTMFRNGKPLHRDAAPQPFTEYWVFGRQNEDWKLRDILPRMDQEAADTAQDGAPSPVQIEWYWGSV